MMKFKESKRNIIYSAIAGSLIGLSMLYLSGCATGKIIKENGIYKISEVTCRYDALTDKFYEERKDYEITLSSSTDEMQKEIREMLEGK